VQLIECNKQGTYHGPKAGGTELPKFETLKTSMGFGVRGTQILSTEASFYIYDRPLTEITVIASVCALNLRIKI